uniref:Uncharacterized protein n=1 Tax=Cacopsylla melanoneura TaxID=428564 RepID=A0A8D9E9G6_9HEMI
MNPRVAVGLYRPNDGTNTEVGYLHSTMKYNLTQACFVDCRITYFYLHTKVVSKLERPCLPFQDSTMVEFVSRLIVLKHFNISFTSPSSLKILRQIVRQNY